MKNKKLTKYFKDFLLYFLSDISYKGLAFLLIPFYTQLLTPAEYGEVSLFTSTASIIAIFFSMGMEKSVYMNEFLENRKESILPNVLLLSTGISIVLSLFIYFFLPKISVFNNYTSITILCLIVNCLGIAYVNIYINFLNSKKKSLSYAIFNFSLSTFSLLLSIVLTLKLVNNKQYGKIFASTIVYLLFIIFICVQSFFKKENVYKICTMKDAFLYGAPLIFHTFSSILLAQSDRVMIKKYLTVEDLGLYSLGYTIGTLLNILITVISKVFLPYFYETNKQKNYQNIKKIVLIYSMIISVAYITLFLCIPFVYNHFISEMYNSGVIISQLILMSNLFLFLYSIYGNYLYFYKSTKLLSIHSFIAAMVNILINVLFLQKYGIYVAVYSTIIGYFVLFLLNYLRLKLKKKLIVELQYVVIPISVVIMISIIILLLQRIS